MVRNKEEYILKFGSLVEKLHEMKWITATESDSTKLQYDDFLISVHHEYQEKSLAFDMKDDLLDAFIGLYFHHHKKLVALWNICKIIFSLSHGQAAVERGFSVNREVLVENLKQKSLVSQRIVYNYMPIGQSAIIGYSFHQKNYVNVFWQKWLKLVEAILYENDLSWFA